MGQPAELADDGRHRGADDQIVEHCQQHRDQQTAHSDVDIAFGARRTGRLGEHRGAARQLRSRHDPSFSVEEVCVWARLSATVGSYLTGRSVNLGVMRSAGAASALHQQDMALKIRERFLARGRRCSAAHGRRVRSRSSSATGRLLRWPGLRLVHPCTLASCCRTTPSPDFVQRAAHVENDLPLNSL